MPRVNVPITKITRDGVTPPSVTGGDGTNDHELAYNNGRVFVEAKNTSGGALNITVVSPGTVDGLAVDDAVVSVNGGATKLIGPRPPQAFNTPDGKVNVDITANTWELRAYEA